MMDKIYAGKELHAKLAPFFNPPELVNDQCDASHGKVVKLFTYTPMPVLVESEKDKTTKAQLAEMENALAIPAETKKLIAAEYLRLIQLHPKWKNSKAMRKAGEKYNVKFDIK
jgi:hypothetical protein